MTSGAVLGDGDWRGVAAKVMECSIPALILGVTAASAQGWAGGAGKAGLKKERGKGEAREWLKGEGERR